MKERKKERKEKRKKEKKRKRKKREKNNNQLPMKHFYLKMKKKTFLLDIVKP